MHESDLTHACACATLVDVVRETLPADLLALEQALTDTLLDAWESRSHTALNKTRHEIEVNGVGDMDGVRAVLAALGKELGPALAEDVSVALRAAMEMTYLIGRNDVFKNLPAMSILGPIDQRAQEWLTDHHLYWVQTHYDRNISGLIASAVSEKIIGQGFSPKKIGAELAAQLEKTLGTQGSPTYWRGVAQNAATTATNFGRVGSFAAAGVRTIRMVNPKDVDTSDVCNYLHGAIFPTKAAVEQRDAMMGATSPELVKEVIHRWTTIKELKAIGGASGGAAADTAALAKAGITLPPFHFHCFDNAVPVWTRRGLVPIADVAVGDEVLTHRLRWRRVLDVMWRPYTKPLNEVDGVLSTPDHPYLILRGGVPIYGRVGDGDLVARTPRDMSGNRLAAAATVVPASSPTNGEVWNLTVEDDETFVVGEAGMIVHNCRTFAVAHEFGKIKPFITRSARRSTWPGADLKAA